LFSSKQRFKNTNSNEKLSNAIYSKHINNRTVESLNCVKKGQEGTSSFNHCPSWSCTQEAQHMKQEFHLFLCRKLITNYKQNLSKNKQNHFRNTSNILRWLLGERQRKDQNAPAQKSKPVRSSKSATSHPFSIEIIQQQILQNTYERKKRKEKKRKWLNQELLNSTKSTEI